MITIYNENAKPEEIVRLKLVDSGSGIGLLAVDEVGEEVATLATIREDGLHLWAYADGLGIKTDKQGFLKVHRDE